MKSALSALCALALGACTGLQAPLVQPMHVYVLDVDTGSTAAPAAAVAFAPPRSRAGFDTAQMAYMRRPHEIEYFAASRWADTPAHMLAPFAAQALGRAGCARPGLRLDTELVRLVQDFTAVPSRVRLTVRLELIETATKRLVAARDFDEIEPAPSDNAYGGVLAAHRAAARLLGRAGELCAALDARRRS